MSCRFDDAYFLEPEIAADASKKSASKTTDSRDDDTQTNRSVVSVGVARGEAGEGREEDGGATPAAVGDAAAAKVVVNNGGAVVTTAVARAGETKGGGGGDGDDCGGDSGTEIAGTDAAEQQQREGLGVDFGTEQGIIQQRAGTRERTGGLLLGDGDDDMAGEGLRPTGGACTSSKRPREEEEETPTAGGSVL